MKTKHKAESGKQKAKGRPAPAELPQNPSGVTDIDQRVAQPAGTVPTDNGEMRRVPRTSVVVVKNVRREFDIEELLASVREQGIVQPLIVRPRLKHSLLPPDLVDKSWRIVKTLPDGKNETVREFPCVREAHGQPMINENAKDEAETFFASLPQGEFELITGERRFRCAQKLNMREVPVIVRALDDKQAREIQLIENMQREGLSAIDEAQGFQDAIDSKDYGDTWSASVQALADKLSKSKSHISNRLTLLKLGESVRSAVAGGKLDTTIALLIASIPDEAKQAEAAAHIQKPNSWDTEPMTFQEAKQYIERKYRQSLNNVAFDVEDAELYPEAGACTKCKLRIAPNVCTNTGCLAIKQQRHSQALAAKFEAKGRTVINEPEKHFYEHSDSLRHGTPFFSASDTCYEDPKRRSYKELLGKTIPPAIAISPNGRNVEVYTNKGLSEALKSAGHKFLEKKKEDKQKIARETELENAVNRELLGDMLKLVESDKHEKAFLIVLLSSQLESRSLSRVFKRRGEPDVVTDEKWYKDQSIESLRSYLLELSLLDYDGEFQDATEAAEEFGIKIPVVKSRVETRLKAEANAKPAPPSGKSTATPKGKRK